MIRTMILLMLCACATYSQTYYMNVRTKGGGITSIPVQEIQKLTFSNVNAVKDQKVATVIKTFALLQNYPNPFNPTTTIQYEIPRSGNVEVRIFNVDGQLVRTITSGVESAGPHSEVWDGRNSSGQIAASGVYIYQVTYENSILGKKMLFLK
jgi:hypothetical protein